MCMAEGTTFFSYLVLGIRGFCSTKKTARHQTGDRYVADAWSNQGAQQSQQRRRDHNLSRFAFTSRGWLLGKALHHAPCATIKNTRARTCAYGYLPVHVVHDWLCFDVFFARQKKIGTSSFHSSASFSPDWRSKRSASRTSLLGGWDSALPSLPWGLVGQLATRCPAGRRKKMFHTGRNEGWNGRKSPVECDARCKRWQSRVYSTRTAQYFSRLD